MLLSHTVLSELYQEKLVTEDEVERMKGERWDLSDIVALIQCTKPPEVVARTTNVLDKYGHNEAAMYSTCLVHMYICVCCVCVVGDVILLQIHNFTQVHKCILHKS